ncbi:MAG TPA: peptidoglycan-binding protein [Gammaproteobacteria bacterium]
MQAFANRRDELSGSVGRGGQNRSEDVKRVQQYLNLAGESLSVDGIAGAQTIAAIERFQREIVGLSQPDGLIEPGRATWKALLAFPENGHEPQPVAWGARVPEAFKVKLVGIADRLRVAPDYLMACMAFETGETFDPAIKNAAGSGAVGLIQFMPSTARALGTTVEALARMTALEQLDYVEKYFKPYGGKLDTLEDVYMAILYPAAIGKPASHALFKSGTVAYEQNKGLDENRDGNITLAEISGKVRAKYEKGLKPGFRG